METTSLLAPGDLVEFLLGVGAALIVWLFWVTSRAKLCTLAAGIEGFSQRRALTIVLAALLGPGIRLALLPWFPPPHPSVHDEHIHLLAADTFRNFRLSNPPHPFARHFGTVYVLQEPSYAAISPPGQGASLAIGWLATGEPWSGVWLGMVLFCGAVTWMLYQWLPSVWALAGGLLVSLRFAVASYWINSYWGGAVGGLGGALALGGLRSWMRSARKRDALLVALGWALVWLSRPYESVPLGLIVAAVVLWKLWRELVGRSRLPGGEDPSRNRLPAPLLQSVGVLAAGVLACLLASAYHNVKVTGHAFLLPYRLAQKQYGVPPTLLWQTELPEPANLNARQRSVYVWSRELQRQRRSSPRMFIRLYGRFWRFFLGFPLSVCLVASLFSHPRRKLGLVWLMLAGAFLWSAFYPFNFPHYSAPYAGLLWVLLMIGLERLRAIAVGKLPIGLFLAVALWVWAAAPVANIAGSSLKECQRKPPRQRVVETLLGRGGAHLVFVQYAPEHGLHDEWVYNGADIDASPIVWAIELDPASNAQLIRYFSGRQVWLVEPDKDGVARPYSRGS
ncbi:MAG: hypothetical protein FJW34_15995 [Acidobacteria bacterium]|nr:hypothetical protein [Acidobacteriota bacterium]